jgi:TMEM175 potassium channel family protein
MGRGRLEAFSDGVIAILITIMVLELKIPHESTWGALFNKENGLPLFTYALTFVSLGIYWVNHHHLLHTIEKVSGGILWANLHLLFWLSLMPFTMFWMNEEFGRVPTAAYGIVLLFSAIAFTILVRTIIATHGTDSRLARAVGRDVKGTTSLVIYALAVPVALFISAWLAIVMFSAVAVIWLVPDRRIERIG